MTLVAVAKADKHRSGAALTGAGVVTTGTGLVAGGVPFVKEPNSLEVWNVRGRPRNASAGSKTGLDAASRLHVRNVPFNARKLAQQPRAGILGFRANTHEAFIHENAGKTHGDDYVKGLRGGKLSAEAKVVHGMRVARRASYGVTGAGAAVTALGVRRLRSKSGVRKAATRSEKVSAGAVAGGGALAGVGHGVPIGLNRFARSYDASARSHILAAQKLAPHFGGLQTIPAKHGAFGEVRRPARTTRKPEISDRKLAETHASAKIKGTPAQIAAVGNHRGTAAQEAHFADVFENTAKGIRRARNPGLALAGAGATGLWASHDARKSTKRRTSTTSRFSKRLVDEETSLSRRRAAGVGIGVAAIGAGVVKSPGVGRVLRLGAKVNTGAKASRYAEAEALRLQQSERISTGGVFLRGLGLGAPMDAVPARWRPTVGVVGGAALVHANTPITRTTVRPVRYPNTIGA